jgi:methionyl-tRNA formyltransferase
MRLVFFGTPDFASRCLRKILSSKHQVVAVVSAPDKPKGRGMKVEPSEVKQLALANHLEALQPENLKDPNFIGSLAACHADLFCVVAFRILPEEVYALPPCGAINLHASLLPKYRGAAPINWVIINGEKETGLTTFFIRRKVDTGDMIMQERMQIGPDETFGELHDRLAERGGDVLLKTIEMIESKRYEPIMQNNSLASSAPKITPGMGNIDWNKSADVIHNLIRGLSPRPAAFTSRKGRKLLVTRSRIIDSDKAIFGPGEVIDAHPQKGIRVACGIGTIELLEVKPESGKTMTGAEYVRGHRLTAREAFEKAIGK